jgi:septum formation topological specificity factor MinE
MEKSEILIVVKTYPEISKDHLQISWRKLGIIST